MRAVGDSSNSLMLQPPHTAAIPSLQRAEIELTDQRSQAVQCLEEVMCLSRTRVHDHAAVQVPHQCHGGVASAHYHPGSSWILLVVHGVA
jgi:hypothetical protein